MLDQMLGIAMLLGLGYFLNRAKIIPQSAQAALSKLCVTVFLPALTVYSFMVECTLENLRSCIVYILYGGVFSAASVALSLLLGGRLAHRDRYLTGIYRYSLAFPNTGGVGTPIVLALYGTQGLFQYSLFLMVNGIVTYSWGVSQLIPHEHREKRSLADFLRGLFTPPFAATLAGMALGLTGAVSKLPPVIPDTLRSVGGCYTVVVLLMTGFVIGDFGMGCILREKKSYLITFLRLLVIPCAFLAALKLAGAPEQLQAMVCLTYACPCGMNIVIYPVSYGEDSEPGASLNLISTALSVVTFPCIFALL